MRLYVLVCLLACLLTCLFIYVAYMYKYTNSLFEGFDQTRIPRDLPASLDWNFQSLVSGIKNYGETSPSKTDMEKVQGVGSSLIADNPVRAPVIYTYRTLNQTFDHVLVNIAHQLEKDQNPERPKNHKLFDYTKLEKYDYYVSKWIDLPVVVKNVVSGVMAELNRRFNIDPPILQFKQDNIAYHWRTYDKIIIQLVVHRGYVGPDIRQQIDIDETINDHLKSDFSLKMIISADKIDRTGSQYHIDYIRFPEIDNISELDSANQYDSLFYLAQSRNSEYRMPTPSEASQQYVDHITKTGEVNEYKCFKAKSFGQERISRVDSQTLCRFEDGVWDRKCRVDSDCPYYQMNRNYPNKFGGCDKRTGYCQMPIGVSHLSYRKALNPEAARCYNCLNGALGSGTIGSCCADQSDSHRYIGLNGPDYSFANDTEQRYKYRKLFNTFNLNWSGYV